MLVHSCCLDSYEGVIGLCYLISYNEVDVHVLLDVVLTKICEIRMEGERAGENWGQVCTYPNTYTQSCECPSTLIGHAYIHSNRYKPEGTKDGLACGSAYTHVNLYDFSCITLVHMHT